MFFLTRRRVAVPIIGLTLACLPVMKSISLARADHELKVGTLRVSRILFLGNSITLHSPAPQIGWTGNWGMAASTRDNDYVHQLLDRIAKVAGGVPKVMDRNIADFERKLSDFNIREVLKEERAFEADVIVLAIGENASAPTTDRSRKQFADAVADLLTQLKRNGHPTIFVRSQFWPDAEKDRLLKNASSATGTIFVDLGRVGTDPANLARSERSFENSAVASHPGDKGMTAIADKLWHAIDLAGSAKKRAPGSG